MNLATVEIKAFVPSRDIQQSAEFYVKEHAENFMMHMLVECVDDWYQQVLRSGVRERFGTRVGIPENRPWGIRDFTLVDPSSVLWRIGQNVGQDDLQREP